LRGKSRSLSWGKIKYRGEIFELKVESKKVHVNIHVGVKGYKSCKKGKKVENATTWRKRGKMRIKQKKIQEVKEGRTRRMKGDSVMSAEGKW